MILDIVVVFLFKNIFLFKKIIFDNNLFIKYCLKYNFNLFLEELPGFVIFFYSYQCILTFFLKNKISSVQDL